MCHGRRESRIYVEHTVEGDPGFSDRLIEEASEMNVELPKDVPGLRVPGSLLGGALEPVDRR